MKLGIIFKKEFQWKYGKKQEFHGIEITINRAWEDKIIIEAIQIGKKEKETFPVDAIQLIYLGDWK
nr:MAG: hypothetical protein [uncultured archaeon]